MCVGNVGLWDHLIHFFVREVLTSQTEWTPSRLLGNAISAACLCDFRVLRDVAGLYLDKNTCRLTLLDVPLWTARRSRNLCRWSSLSLCCPVESLAGLTSSSAFATVCSLMAGATQFFVRCAVLPVTAVFSCCSLCSVLLRHLVVRFLVELDKIRELACVDLVPLRYHVKCASGIRGMACPCTFFASAYIVFVVMLLSGHPRPSSAEALVYRGCPCRDPPVCPPMPRQDGIGDTAPTLFGCWCCCVVVVVVEVFLLTSRSRVSWNTTPLLDGLRWHKLAIVLCFLVAFSEVFVNVSFSSFVLLFVTVHALCRLTNHVLELHRLNEIRDPFQGSFSHNSHPCTSS